MEKDGIGGCIIKDKKCEPSQKGSLIYLNGGEDLRVLLSKVVAAGGKIVLAKTANGSNSFMVLFADTKGSKGGLLSKK